MDDNQQDLRRIGKGKCLGCTCSRCPHLWAPCRCGSHRLGYITITITITYSITQWDMPRCTTISHTSTHTRPPRSSPSPFSPTCGSATSPAATTESIQAFTTPPQHMMPAPHAAPVGVPAAHAHHAYATPMPHAAPGGAPPARVALAPMGILARGPQAPAMPTTGGIVRGDAARATRADVAPARGSPQGDDCSWTAASTCRADARGNRASSCYRRKATSPRHICAPGVAGFSTPSPTCAYDAGAACTRRDGAATNSKG